MAFAPAPPSTTDITFLWLGLALPMASFLFIVAFCLKRPLLAGYVTVAAIFGTFLVSIAALLTVMQTNGARLEQTVHWFTVGDAEFNLGIVLDPLGAVMLIIVTLVSTLVQIYSIGYMKDDPGYARYFSFMSLFTFSMLGLGVPNNFVQIYIFWELVGLCSYLLIGFWYQRPAAASAAKKAFVTTRFGDLGVL